MLIRTLIHTATIVAALALAACATTQPKSTDDSKQASTDVSDATVLAADSYDGDGMEIPLDGTSLEAFDTSMARVKRHTDAAHYTTLENAIEYLLVYDLEVKRSKEKLVTKLNGLTGNEVIERVGWRKPPRGKSKAEKGADDAKIIDT